MKKILVILFALLLVGGLAACGGDGGDAAPPPAEEATIAEEPAPPAEEETTPEEEAPEDDPAPPTDEPSGERLVLGVAMLDMTHEFFVNMIYAGDQAAENADVDIIWQSADSNLERQIALIENFIEMGVDCILVDPFDGEAMIPVAERAAEAGIPFISMGNFIDTPAVTATLYNDRQDTYVLGQLLMHYLEYTDRLGEVAILYGAAGNFVSDERQGGFETAAAEMDFTNTSLPVGWDVAETLRVTQDLLLSNPDIVGIHSFSDGNTAGVLTAIEQAGRTGEIVITSYDGDPEMAELVADGDVLATLLTGARRIGYWNVWLGAQLARGDELPQRNYLPSHFVMTEETRALFEEWGLGYDGISIITPEVALDLFHNFADDFQ